MTERELLQRTINTLNAYFYDRADVGMLLSLYDEISAHLSQPQDVEKDAEKMRRVLWEVCKPYGKPGECIYIGFKAAIAAMKKEEGSN